MRPQSTVSDKVDFLLMCVHPGEWSCEVEVEFVIVGKIKASISKKVSIHIRLVHKMIYFLSAR